MAQRECVCEAVCASSRVSTLRALTGPASAQLDSGAAGAPAWPGPVGIVNKELLASFLPPPGAGRVLVCGPPGFMKALSGEKKSPSDQGELAGMLKELRFAPAEVFKF